MARGTGTGSGRSGGSVRSGGADRSRGSRRPLWRAGGESERPRWYGWLIVGVAVFLVVDVVVVALALGQNRAPVDVTSSRPIPTFTNVPSTPGAGGGASSTGAPGSGAASGSPVDATLPVSRFVAADDATSAWRASQGSCDAAGAVVERTTDGGVTWSPVSIASTGVQQIFRFTSLGAASAAMVGAAGTACTPAAFRTFSAGSTWSANAAELAQASYIDPAQPTVVQTSAGPVTPPCPNPRQVVAGAANLTVLCTGQLVVQQADGSWSSASVPGALAATSTTEGLVVVSSGVAGCAGLSVAELPAQVSNARLTTVGCLAAETAPADVAISEAAGSLWIWSNAASYVSADGGATW